VRAPALQFVSYRHDDTSLIRDSRDQGFLLSVKQEYGPALVDNVHKFERIFGQLVQTDPGLRTNTGILDLLGTLISSASLRVRQVQFEANLVPPGPLPCNCVTASQQQIAGGVSSFLNGGSDVLPAQSTTGIAHAVAQENAPASPPLAPAAPAQLTQARRIAAQLPFALEYPEVEDQGGAGTPVDLRSYLIHAPGGPAYPVGPARLPPARDRAAAALAGAGARARRDANRSTARGAPRRRHGDPGGTGRFPRRSPTQSRERSEARLRGSP